MTLHQDSERLLSEVSRFLCDHPHAITGEDLRSLGLPDDEEAYRVLLAAWLGFDTEQQGDAALCRAVMPEMVRKLDPSPFRNDPYAAALGSVSGSAGAFRLGRDCIRAYELFVRDDMIRLPDGHVIPRLGFFPEDYSFPALWENGRLWMTVTPNEVNTIRPAAEQSHGQVLCLGLGLGYYAFHALRNPAVSRLTVVERDAGLIGLFRRLILPHMPYPDKLTLVCGDGFEAVRKMQAGEYDTVFADLWHDAGDGLPMYERLRGMEKPGADYLYWIEPTMKLYLEG